MKVKIINKSNNPIPKYETSLSAGMDLRAYLEGPITLHPGERKLIKTGLYIELPEGCEAQVRPRSGLAFKNGITVLNSPGTIDADYRGDLGVILINHSNKNFIVKSGDRIAQLVISKFERVEWESTEKINSTMRGSSGFGSTGSNWYLHGMRFLYLIILVSLIGCGTTKKRVAINNSVFKNNLSVKKSVFTPFVFDKILISSKVNFQYNRQFLTFDLTSRIDSGSKILFSGNLFLPIFKILIDNDRAYGYDRITKSFFESSVDEINKKYKIVLGLNELQNILIGNPIFPFEDINKSNKKIVNDGLLINYKYKNLQCKFLFDDKLIKLKNQSIIHYESGTSIQLFYSGSLNENLKHIPSLVSIKINYENDIINLNIINRSTVLERDFPFSYKVPRGFKKINLWK